MSRSDPSSSLKWEITIFSTFIFLLVSSPFTYKLTNFLFGKIIGPTSIYSCPTLVGIILHTIVYILLIRYSMDLKLFK